MLNNYFVDKKKGLLLWKASNLWQSLLRNVLISYSLTLNEFIILETLLFESKNKITQVYLSKSSGINISVISTVLKVLHKKSLIKRKSDFDNRKKIIELTEDAKSLINSILPITNEIEKNFFLILGKEQENFSNSMKLILNKKIRIKAEKFKKL